MTFTGGIDFKISIMNVIAQSNVCFKYKRSKLLGPCKHVNLEWSKNVNDRKNYSSDEIFLHLRYYLKLFQNPLKFFMLQAQYRSVLDLSDDALLASGKGFNKIIDAINILENFKSYTDKTTDFDVEKWIKGCYDAMNDDFNNNYINPNIFEAVKFINKIKARAKHL